MKKQTKKLVLAKETMQSLNPTLAQAVKGGVQGVVCGFIGETEAC
jgi:hypothetical protein